MNCMENTVIICIDFPAPYVSCPLLLFNPREYLFRWHHDIAELLRMWNAARILPGKFLPLLLAYKKQYFQALLQLPKKDA